MVSINGYGNGVHAPGKVGMGDNTYIVAHNLIRAHAKAYRVYHNEFAATQGGILSTLQKGENSFRVV